MRSGFRAAALAAGLSVFGWSQFAEASVMQQLVVNGEFEDPTCNRSWCAINPANVPGWNTTDSAIEFWRQGSFRSPTQGSDGLATGQHLEINTHRGNRTITQEIFVPLNIDTGVAAQFSFDAWSRGNSAGSYSVTGSASGVRVASTAIDMNRSGWSENSHMFTLIAGETVTLSFKAIGGVTPHIDQVSLLISTLPEALTSGVPTPSSDLPEPGTLALFGFGLAGLGAASRRRRSA